MRGGKAKIGPTKRGDETDGNWGDWVGKQNEVIRRLKEGTVAYKSILLQYVLESYTEARSTSEATEAYTLGQYLDRYTVACEWWCIDGDVY